MLPKVVIGVEMAKRFHGSYAGKEDRRRQEERDGSMMPSGSGSFANMPTELVMREYPKAYDGMPENLDDSIRGIDSQIKSDNSKKMAHIQPEKI